MPLPAARRPGAGRRARQPRCGAVATVRGEPLRARGRGARASCAGWHPFRPGRARRASGAMPHRTCGLRRRCEPPSDPPRGRQRRKASAPSSREVGAPDTSGTWHRPERPTGLVPRVVLARREGRDRAGSRGRPQGRTARSAAPPRGGNPGGLGAALPSGGNVWAGQKVERRGQRPRRASRPRMTASRAAGSHGLPRKASQPAAVMRSSVSG